MGKLLEELFPNYEVRQEYSVSRVNPGFPSNREKFDFIVLGLKIVIEAHGIQHYNPICFGGITIDRAKKIFAKRQKVDTEKQEAAQKAGWAYLVVKYTEKKIGPKELSERISETIKNTTPAEEIKPAKPKAKIKNRGFVAGGGEKIPNRPFQKLKGKHKWPTRKIPRRKNDN